MAELIGELIAGLIEPLVGLIFAAIEFMGSVLALVLEGLVHLFLPSQSVASRERQRPE